MGNGTFLTWPCWETFHNNLNNQQLLICGIYIICILTSTPKTSRDHCKSLKANLHFTLGWALLSDLWNRTGILHCCHSVITCAAAGEELYVIWFFDSKHSIAASTEMHCSCVYFKFLFASQSLSRGHERLSWFWWKTPLSDKEDMAEMRWSEIRIIYYD